MRSPVLFLVFNRPEPTARVFATIRAAAPPRLYVAADGPRMGRPGEEQACLRTREIASAVDWPCEVRTLFRDRNKGCKQAVSEALTWFFEQEPEGVVLEDDCIAEPGFFAYCDELLERYRDDERVGFIGGTNYQRGRLQPEASYYFSRYAHVWGWASWRRVWRHYDADARQWPVFRGSGGLERVLGARAVDRSFWRRAFDAVYSGALDTWDHQLTLALWTQGQLSVIPGYNLVSNIGFDEQATHTRDVNQFANMPTQPLALPLRHPPTVAPWHEADGRVAHGNFGSGLMRRALNKVIGRVRRGLARRADLPAAGTVSGAS